MITSFALVLALLLAAPARADVMSEMENFWRGAAVNTTGPTAFDGQASGHWTLGNLYLRAPVRSESIATVSLPSYRAGCGGIDAFAGAFSFIDSDQMIAFARAVAQNAAGFAFELALETISPVIAETMSKLRALAQWVNNQNLDSCETAQALVGAVWSKNDRASAAICAAVGTRQGIFSDYAAARHGCGADGKRHSTLAAGTGALRDQAPVNVNYAWRAVQASGFLASDRDLGEFAMSVSGSVIVTAPVADGDDSGPRVRILEPLALDRRVTEILMEGGAVVDQEVDALAEAVALDVLQVWISDLHRTVEERAGALDVADGERLASWREGLRRNRTALARHRHEGLAQFNTALAVVEKLRLIETELAGALSAELRAALAFSRGTAGSR